MIDGLDIAASVREGQQYRRAARRWQVIGVALVVLAVLGAQGLATLTLRPLAQLYFLDGQDWREIPLPEGESPYEVLALNDGTLWVGTHSDCGFLQYQAGSWSDCTGGVSAPYFDRPISVTNGDQLWSVRDNTVIHFDGTQWITYENALSGYGWNDIEASPLGVFVINLYGQIATFDGTRWQTQQLSTLIPMSNLGSTYASSADLVKTPDGIIYLAYNGNLFRYDGQSWQPFGGPTRLSISRMYGATDTVLWVYDHTRGVGTLNLAGRLTFSRKTFNSASIFPDQLVIRNNAPLLIDIQGIYELDNGNWRILTTPPRSNWYQDLLSVDHAGNLWWIAYTQNPYMPYSEVRRDVGLFMRYGWWIIALGGLALLTVVQPGKAARARRTQRRLWAALYDVPDLVTLQVGGGLYRLWLPLITLLVPVAMVMAAWGEFRRERWYAVLAGVLLLIWLALPFGLRQRGYTPARRSLAIEDYPLLLAQHLLVTLGLGLLLYFPIEQFWATLGFSPSIGVLLYVPFVLYLAWQLLRVWFVAHIHSANNLINRQQEEAALKQLAWMERWLPLQAWVQLLRAQLAAQQGDVPTAADLFRRSLYEFQTQPQHAATILIQLAHVREQQARPDLALKLRETAVVIYPEGQPGYLALADFYERQQIEPERVQSLRAAAGVVGN